MALGGAAAAAAVRFLDGDRVLVAVEAAATVGELRAGVAAARRISNPRAIALLRGGVELADSDGLGDLGVEFDCILRETLGSDWASIMAPPAVWAPGYGNAMAVVGKKLWVIAGMQCGDHQPEDVGECWPGTATWVTEGVQWELLPRPPWGKRRFHAAVVDSTGRLLVAGGEDAHGVTYNDAWSFDGSSWQRLDDFPQQTLPDAAVGTESGALVIFMDGTIMELSPRGWEHEGHAPENIDVTSCAMVGESLHVGTRQGAVYARTEGQWTAVLEADPSPDENIPYTMVCSGPAGQLFIYKHTRAADGLGTVLVADGAGDVRELASAVIPRFADGRETMGLMHIFPIWKGIGILSCCGHLLYSESALLGTPAA